MRGKDYGLLDLGHRSKSASPCQPMSSLCVPESGTSRDLFECGDLPVTAEGHRSRVIIATHPQGRRPARLE